MLTVVFLVVFDALLTRTALLWGPTGVENQTKDVVFAQAYRVARRLYGPGDRAAREAADLRVAVLGNSRILMAIGTSPVFEEALEVELPGRDVYVDHLGLFGSSIEEIEIISRHLERVDPDIVVLPIGPPDVLIGGAPAYEQHAAQFLRVGFDEAPSGETTMASRVDQWLRTVWPTYRFREFLRAVLLDRFWYREPVEPDLMARVYEDMEEFFEITRGEFAEETHDAYRLWLESGSIDDFAHYSAIGRAPSLASAKHRVRNYGPASSEAPGLRALDATLRRMSEGDWVARVVLMPRARVLEQDRDRLYHDPEIERRAEELIRQKAERWGIPVIDAGSWSEDSSYLDFDHLIPVLSGFHEPLAKEMSHAAAD